MLSQITSAPAGAEWAQWQTYSSTLRLARDGQQCRFERIDGGKPIILPQIGPDACDARPLFNEEIEGLSPRGDLGAQQINHSANRLVQVYNHPDRAELDITQELVYADRRVTVSLRLTLLKLSPDPLPVRQSEPGIGVSSSPSGAAARWRLRRDKPLVYWIDPSTPRQWIDSVKSGIQDWEPVFRAAGFPGGIRARLAPRSQPFLLPERSAYFHWIESPLQTATGNIVVDGRSGEILRGQVRLHSAVLTRLQDNYFVQLAPIDPAARRYPPSTESLGRLIRVLVSHEVGHTLGLAHNAKAAAGYPVRKLRDRNWLRQMGVSPTIMNYGFFNFVAQPEDNLPSSLLLTGIGPADRWTFRWLYEGPFPDLRAEQEKSPWLRASGTRPDATDLDESLDAIGRSDPIWTAEMGLKNLENSIRLMPAGAGSGLRSRFVSHWMNLMLGVAAIPGGRRLINYAPPRYTDVPQEHQHAALELLISKVFQTPSFLIATDALDEATERLQAAQLLILSRVLAQDRLDRMSRPEAPVAAAEMIRILSDGLFAPEPDEHRRKLQRAYVEILAARAWVIAQREFRYLLPRASSESAARMTDLLQGKSRPTVVSDRPRPGLFPLY